MIDAVPEWILFGAPTRHRARLMHDGHMKLALVAMILGLGLPCALVRADAQRAPDQPCTRNMECPDTEYCVKVAAGMRCARPCNPKRGTPCTKDQRCVKDGPKHVCRPLD